MVEAGLVAAVLVRGVRRGGDQVELLLKDW